METVLAPAKLTVTLRVTGVREDGYHLIDAEMVSLDLYDELLISDGDDLVVRSGQRGLHIPRDGDNLVERALRLVGRTASVELLKRIPAGAGLGGGSSDAAAILRWAGGVSDETAASIGADVAFCQRGGRARVRGIGEIVDPLPFELRHYTLVTPPFGVSTPVVYRRWDDMDGPTGDGDNDLEPAAVDAYPELASWRDGLERATGERAQLAGSGGTWFVPGAHNGLDIDGVEARVVSTVAASAPAD